MRIAIIGAGDLGLQLAHYIRGENDVVGFFDDTKSKGVLVDGIPILGGLANIEDIYKESVFDRLVLAIGYKHLRKRAEIFASLKERVPFFTYIHPTVWMDSSAKVGEGSVILPGCLLDRNVCIGENSFLNIGCCIAHDTEIGRHSFLAPRVSVAGFCKLGDFSFLGIGTVFRDNIQTCESVQTGAGAVVCKSLLEAGLYVGVPARFTKPF